MAEKRMDDYEVRRAHLKDLTDEELYERFWDLAGQIVEPLMELGRKNTTPSVERSVLLRMGFSSMEVKPIVDEAVKRNLMGKGCGHIVWRIAEEKGISVREAGVALSRGRYWEDAERIFGKAGV